jgi:hypothetical protein
MKKLNFDYTPPVNTLLFIQQRSRRKLDLVYGYDTLGGEVPFTS